jgi:hypothetical protein
VAPGRGDHDAVTSHLERRSTGPLARIRILAGLRRPALTRTEYQNAVRDLLALDVDVTSLPPADDSSYG